MSFTIGIDLGTTYSCVGVFQNDKVEIIANEQGHRTTPSYVAFTDTERLIGEVAKNQAIRNPKNTVFDVKRIIGRQFNDSVVQEGRKLWPFKVTDSRKGMVISVEYKNEQRRFTPEEISSMVLSKMKRAAEAYLGETVTDAVITVPAYFNHQQRAATKDAGKIAGLNVRRIINEPTAAALAYGIGKSQSGKRRVLVFDLGGGTFDVSILKIMNGNRFYVLATAGDTHLGGQDFDNRLVKYFANQFKKKHNMDLTKSASATQKLRFACEQAKHTLSSATQACIEIDSLYQGEYFESKISRARFEDLCKDLFRRTLDSVGQALDDAKLDKSRIDDVVLVGGSTRIPKVQQLLQEYFKGKKLNVTINPDEAVAHGAAIQAVILADEPDESTPDIVLRDVLALSVGVEVGGLSMCKLIQRNTGVPVRRTETFTLGRENQDAAMVRVLEGERVLTTDNNVIGEFTLSGLRPRRRDDPGIKVTFDIDADSIIRVSAADAKTGKSMEITITERNGRLSKKDIERMIREAEEFRAEDDALRERIDVRNQLEGYLIKARYSVEDIEGDVLNSEERELALNMYNKTMEWLEKNSLAEREELVYRLRYVQELLSPVMEKVAAYISEQEKAAEEAAAAGAAAPGGRSAAAARDESSDESAEEVVSMVDADDSDDGDFYARRRDGMRLAGHRQGATRFGGSAASAPGRGAAGEERRRH